ncbi:hypothetical protein, variant [Aphanomyces astaci]|uniref:RING-type domain-containing protein n=1 Tax=Aphanomyces astaci TaxID=112090 RepID=W4GC46_APHAT|nr:hypothetical protein, variant [Aphanomyces astaci]ETV76629.1 hypothetical protein, variant [Aphanomyces astaci]|eukprot:XP_009833540.1 hypothetical protein, variant [Aphanomyces astaci]
MEKKMEKMVQNNVQQLGNRIPKAKRAQTILDMARLQHELKRRVVDVDEDAINDSTTDGTPGVRSIEWHTPGTAPTTLPTPTHIHDVRPSATPSKKRRIIDVNDNTVKPPSNVAPAKPSLPHGTTEINSVAPPPTSSSTIATHAIQMIPRTESAQPEPQPAYVARMVNLDPAQRFNGLMQLPPPTPSMDAMQLTASSSSMPPPRTPPLPKLAAPRPPVATHIPDIAAAPIKRTSPPPPAASSPAASSSLSKDTSKSAMAKPKALSALSTSFKSMCFSTEDPVTSIDATPDGQCVIAAFSNGSVRLFDVNSTCTEERFGYLLGHLDEELNQQMAPSVVRVKVTADGCYCFVGCRGNTPKTIMAIHLDKFRHEKDNDDDDNLQKYFMNDSKMRGFADVSPNASAPGNPLRSYYLVAGLGVGHYRVWRFDERPLGADPSWTYLHQFGASSNTALHAYIFSVSATTIGFAGVGSDGNLKLITFPTNQHSQHTAESVQKVIPNTSDISYIKGDFAYGYATAGRFYRLALSNPTQHRDSFDLVVDAARKNSRSIGFVEHICATDDGVHVVAITDQVVYYCMTDGAASTGNYVMHMMGASIPSQLVPRYGVPCAIYVPNHVAVQEPVLLLTTNAEEESDGFFTVDPVRKLQRQMARGKPATGLNCWVCGSHSSLHWGLKSGKPNQSVGTTTITPSKAKAKPPAKDKPQPVAHVHTNLSQRHAASQRPAPQGMTGPPRSVEIQDLQENVLTLEAELAKAQTRVTQVKNEADRRLRAELQLRRSWKKQQLEFEAQLATANANVDNLTIQNVAIMAQFKEMETKLAHDAVRHEQEAGVRVQYDQLCGQVRDKLSRVDDHQKILEQTTKSLLQQLQRNSQLLKHDGAETNVETAKSECVICRDRPANTAVYPCGHLCFCQEDGEKYQNHLRHQKQCPVCQVEMISLLRIYAP